MATQSVAETAIERKAENSGKTKRFLTFTSGKLFYISCGLDIILLLAR